MYKQKKIPKHSVRWRIYGVAPRNSRKIKFHFKFPANSINEQRGYSIDDVQCKLREKMFSRYDVSFQVGFHRVSKFVSKKRRQELQVLRVSVCQRTFRYCSSVFGYCQWNVTEFHAWSSYWLNVLFKNRFALHQFISLYQFLAWKKVFSFLRNRQIRIIRRYYTDVTPEALILHFRAGVLKLL